MSVGAPVDAAVGASVDAGAAVTIDDSIGCLAVGVAVLEQAARLNRRIIARVMAILFFVFTKGSF
jgi:hypothetical protein